MGSVISQAANGIGCLLGSAITAPFKTVFGRSCEGICSGPWDMICFIEHLCVSNLLRLLMILVLCYITLLFFYILFKVGICQCIGRSLCKMCWAACEAYWYALEDITSFLWQKLINTKRINCRRRRHHRHFQDVEQGYSTSDEPDFSGDSTHHWVNVTRKNNSVKWRRRERFQNHSFKSSSGIGASRRHHRVKLKNREVSANVRGRSRRLRSSSRQIQSRKVRNVGREAKVFKRRRVN